MQTDKKPRPRILVADDDDGIRKLLDYNFRRVGFDPLLASDGAAAMRLVDDDLACALIDLKMPEVDGMQVLAFLKEQHPELPVIMISALGQTKDAVAAIKQGALEYVTKPFDLEELIELTRQAAVMGKALHEGKLLRDAVARPPSPAGFVGSSAGTHELLRTIEKIAPLDSTILITGESGVGKGLLARIIHQASWRTAGPFITVSCPALPRELIESEMFGHERGAFTGAHQRRIGRIEMATRGTLFLDEVGDLPLALQPKLLNVLQDRQYQRLGGQQVMEADIRLIAATNLDLKEKVASREFREDLFYRLNVIPLHVPPLRERIEDLDDLTGAILRRIARMRGTPPFTLKPDAVATLGMYSWPGNVRELENVLERSSALASGREIGRDDLPVEIRESGSSRGTGTGTPSLAGLTLEEIERVALEQTLEMCNGNKAAAARRLGVTEKTVYNMIARHRLR